MATRKKKTKTIEIVEYPVRLHTFFGSFEIFSEISAKDLCFQMYEAIQKAAAEADERFHGWWDWEKMDGTGRIILNLHDIRGVEDLPDQEDEN